MCTYIRYASVFSELAVVLAVQKFKTTLWSGNGVHTYGLYIDITYTRTYYMEIAWHVK